MSVKKVTVGIGMMEIGMMHYLILAGLLFTIGVFGIFLNRKNMIVILMSIGAYAGVNINFVTLSPIRRI